MNIGSQQCEPHCHQTAQDWFLAIFRRLWPSNLSPYPPESPLPIGMQFFVSASPPFQSVPAHPLAGGCLKSALLGFRFWVVHGWRSFIVKQKIVDICDFMLNDNACHGNNTSVRDYTSARKKRNRVFCITGTHETSTTISVSRQQAQSSVIDFAIHPEGLRDVLGALQWVRGHDHRSGH